MARVRTVRSRCLLWRVRILHALRVHDQECAVGVAPLFHAGRANLIFLMPAPVRSRRPGLARSTWQSRNM